MRAKDAVLDLHQAPAEAIRLLEEWRKEAVALNYPGAEPGARWAIDRVRSGELEGRLWIGPRDEAVGLAWGEHAPGVGRRYSLQLSPGFRNEQVLRHFLDGLQAEAATVGPVVGLYDFLPGVDQPSLASVVGPLGKLRVVREDLSFPLDRPLPVPRGPAPHLRPLDPADAARLARLLEVAYAEDPIERSLFLQSLDPADDARLGMEGLLGTEVGQWIPSASFGVDDGQQLAGATLVNRMNGILISEVMVAPAHRRRGLASHLLHASLSALRKAGEPAPRLVVTLRNQRAYRLYRRLGFVPVPDATGGVWLNLPALGISLPAAPQE